MRITHLPSDRPAAASVAHASGLARVRRLQLAQIAMLIVMALLVTGVGLLSAASLLDATVRQRQENDFLRDLVALRDEGRLAQVEYWRTVARGENGVNTRLALRLGDFLTGADALARRQASELTAGPEAAAAANRVVREFDAIATDAAGYLTSTDPVDRNRRIERTLGRVERLSVDFDAWVRARVDAANRASVDLDRTMRRLGLQALAAIGFLTAVGVLLWWALARARQRVLAHIERAGREQAALRHVAELVAREGPDEEIFRALAGEVVVLTGAAGGWVVRVDGGDAVLMGAATTGDDALERLAADGFRGPIAPGGPVALALSTGKPARAEGDIVLPEALRAALAGRDVGVGLATPVSVGGTVWGALVVVAAGPEDLPAGTEDALLPFARLAGLAIANADARRRLAERASNDPLTGLPNHGVFHERLHDETAVAIRHGAPLSLAVIDLDHFKEINDTHGHQVGDTVLAEVAARLRSSVRDGEMLARVGGEEFAWIMPGTRAEDAVMAAERARARISAEPVAGLEGLSASVGVCELDDAGTAGELFRLADGALLQAKAQGRNTTVRYVPGSLDEPDGDERLRRAERARTLAALRALARAVDARDAATQRHSERVADLTHRIAIESGWGDARARAHDVGKIGIPDEVLRKPGGLTDGEFALVAAHPELGAAIVAEVLSDEQVAWVRHHHERMDGRGYPDGLSGEAIPEGARILAVADAWDAMTADRPYRRALSPDAALAECRRVAGDQLDPAMVAVMERLVGVGGPVPGDAPAGRAVNAAR